MIFFVFGAVFSFRSIEKTKALQITIITVRVITIILFFGGALFICMRDGVKKLTPKDGGFFNFSSFIELFSNVTFCFMYHTGLPNIVNNLQKKEDLKYVVKYSFIFSCLAMLVIPVTGVMAFGEELGTGQNLKYYNFDFQQKIPFIYYFTSFYIFLNIAAFSVYIIVIRGSILSLVRPQVDARKFSSSYALMQRKPW